ncbi:MAG: CmcJ/NvfI family oxidoreductase, partial [Pseudomonadota bacterium]
MVATENTVAENTRIGSFRYMSDATEPSLLRNNKVLTRRDRDGSDAGSEGIVLETRQMPVQDARTLSEAERLTLAYNGFEVINRPLADANLDFLDHNQVLHAYYPHCEEIVRQASCAALVKAFDHNIRSAGGKKSKQRIQGGQQVQGPAHVVHGDYTLTSAPQRLRDLTKPPKENDTLRSLLADGETLLDADAVEQAIDSGRFAILNLWRNIAEEPVAT